ncbi:MAG: carbamoyltransferase [Melioribacter sp.]|uniref:carbamoyltransferase family protein n=1 Tax=Rosettibacter primus TaxID=3111523 RepID=UPI00247DC343|nr:carbamoyltransferase [Melioribacter sp.]
MYILGISAYYHDSAACIIKDGDIIAAAQEERFTRKKHDHRFPINAINFCISSTGINVNELSYVAFYDKPFLKFERLLETYLTFAPRGLKSFLKAMPLWIKEKLWIKELIKKEINFEGEVIFPEHHESHAASAFFPSPFNEAAFLTLDGVGEWTTTSYGIGQENKIQILADIKFPHSLGLLYSAFTYYTGFKVNSGEYKVMGLAPYGEPKYVKLIYDNLIDVKEDGSFKLNMDYFDYCTGLTMTNEKFHKLFGGKPRKPESKLTQREMDIAASIQVVTEEVILKMVRHIKKETNMKYLCLAGGVALNCVANGKILKENLFEDIWIQPAAGDAGGSLGAALFTWYQYLDNKRIVDKNDKQKGSFLGPSYENGYIEEFLNKNKIPYKKINQEEIAKIGAELIAQGNVVGWFQGRMEFGPRALGARSILGDARFPDMQKKINLKIKFRESFRPFAPSVLEEKVSEYFNLDRPSPYMLLVADVKEERRKMMTEEQKKLFGIDKLNVVRSDIPAVTHVDYSARIQTVNKETNPIYYDLIKEYEKLTGYSVIVNTSFNVRGEPIVCKPEEAYICFMRTNIDYLIMSNYLLDKKEQKPLSEDVEWKKQFELD